MPKAKKKPERLTPIEDYQPTRRPTKHAAGQGGTPASSRDGDGSRPAAVCEGPDLSHISPDLRALAVPVETLAFLRCNPRKHQPEDVDALAKSLAKFGQRKPVVVNMRTGEIEAGNGTLQAALTLNWQYVARVRVDDLRGDLGRSRHGLGGRAPMAG